MAFQKERRVLQVKLVVPFVFVSLGKRQAAKSGHRQGRLIFSSWSIAQ